MQPMIHCPICQTALETRQIAPCWDCGHRPGELAECAAGEHLYHEFRAFGGLPIVLCDFCDADFGSYYDSYFGGSGAGLVGEVLELVSEVAPPVEPRHDHYCPKCEHRLDFLLFQEAAIKLHADGKT